jgi:hypothetical protein
MLIRIMLGKVLETELRKVSAGLANAWGATEWDTELGQYLVKCHGLN